MTSSLPTAFAPTGKLRASINLGNPILANKDTHTGQPVGLSIDLAHALAERLGVEAMGTPKSRGEEAASYLQAFVLEMCSTGFITAALQRHPIVLTTAGGGCCSAIKAEPVGLRTFAQD